MDATTVSKIIADDLAANPEFVNTHGVDLKSCLVPPERVRFKNSFRDGEYLELWLVLRELPDVRGGYLVVFDDQQQMFGLGVYGDKDPVFIGYYGSFTETLSDL